MGNSRHVTDRLELGERKKVRQLPQTTEVLSLATCRVRLFEYQKSPVQIKDVGESVC